jgi:hypothetical protein
MILHRNIPVPKGVGCAVQRRLAQVLAQPATRRGAGHFAYSTPAPAPTHLAGHAGAGSPRQVRRGGTVSLNAHAFGFPQLLVAAFLAVVYRRPLRALPWPAKPLSQPMPGTVCFNRPARSAERNKEA